jgi:hypothetical protein
MTGHGHHGPLLAIMVAVPTNTCRMVGELSARKAAIAAVMDSSAAPLKVGTIL